MIEAYETHFAQRLFERFGIRYDYEVKVKLLKAISTGAASFVAKQENKAVFWTKVLGRPMFFIVDRNGTFVTCLYDRSYEMSNGGSLQSDDYFIRSDNGSSL